MSKTLQPCPFCGSEPWGIFSPHQELGSWWVECHGPDENTCCGDWYFQPEEERDRDKARAEVAAAWNYHPVPAGSPQERRE